VIESHYLAIPENDTVSVGISPLSRNIDLMEDYMLSQAAILYTKCESAYSIDRYISVQSNNTDRDNNQSAQLRYNVVTDLDRIKKNKELLIKLGEQQICGHMIALYSFNELDSALCFVPENNFKIFQVQPVQQIDNTILSYGKSKSTSIDSALDLAFNQALSDLSKYQNIKVKALQKESADYSESVLDIDAINEISSVQIAEIQINILKNDITIEYEVMIKLRKKV
jgi:hypothetical protein